MGAAYIGALAQQALAGLAEVKKDENLKTTWSREGCAERLRSFAKRAWLGDDATLPEECARYGWRCAINGEGWSLRCDDCGAEGTTSQSSHAKHCVWNGSPQPFSIWLDDYDEDGDGGSCDLCLRSSGHRRYCPKFEAEILPTAKRRKRLSFASSTSSNCASEEVRASIASLLEKDED